MDAISANESKSRRRPKTTVYFVFLREWWRKKDRKTIANIQLKHGHVCNAHIVIIKRTNEQRSANASAHMFGWCAGEKNNSITLIVCTGRNRIAMCLSTNHRKREKERKTESELKTEKQNARGNILKL